ncbi:copia protein [Trichonephila clavipes]|nr:copia protein [Trichonephila clavipes]
MEAAGVERIQLLNKSNWNSWKENMKFLLMERGCWSFIEGTEPPLDETTATRPIQNLIPSTTSPSKAWIILKEQFEPISRASVIRLLDEFFSIKFNPDTESIAVFIARIRKMVERLKDVGHSLNDMYCAFQAIRTLSPEFQGIAQILYRWPDEDFKLDKVEIELIAEENRLKQLKNDLSKLEFTDNSVSAYATSKFKPKPDENKSKFKKSKINDRIGPCYLCKQEGHLKRNCKYLNFNSSKFSASNLNYCFEERGKNEIFVTEANVNVVIDKFNWIIDTAASRHFCNIFPYIFSEKQGILNCMSTGKTGQYYCRTILDRVLGARAAGVHYRLFSVWTLVPVRLDQQLSDHSTVDEIASGAADCCLTYTMANCPQRWLCTVSTVCIIKGLWNGAKDSLEDDARPGQDHRFITSGMIAEVLDNRRINMDEVHWFLGIRVGTTHTIMH